MGCPECLQEEYTPVSRSFSAIFTFILKEWSDISLYTYMYITVPIAAHNSSYCTAIGTVTYMYITVPIAVQYEELCAVLVRLCSGEIQLCSVSWVEKGMEKSYKRRKDKGFRDNNGSSYNRRYPQSNTVTKYMFHLFSLSYRKTGLKSNISIWCYFLQSNAYDSPKIRVKL